MQCPVCHNEVGSLSGFCPHCGANLAAAAPAPAPASAAYSAPPPGYPPAQPAASSGLTPNAAAAVAYITVIPAILFLVIEPYNKIPLVRFHSFQSIALAVIWFALWVCMFFLHMVLLFVPFIHLLIFPVELLIFFGLFIAWLIVLLKASQGEFYKLPIIGDFAMKQAQS
ncbi:MAG: hypothetical protein ABR910_01515 [Acidobacteriaceae bacterium]|jgi:uncharacterized membrane protein